MGLLTRNQTENHWLFINKYRIKTHTLINVAFIQHILGRLPSPHFLYSLLLCKKCVPLDLVIQMSEEKPCSTAAETAQLEVSQDSLPTDWSGLGFGVWKLGPPPQRFAAPPYASTSDQTQFLSPVGRFPPKIQMILNKCSQSSCFSKSQLLSRVI